MFGQQVKWWSLQRNKAKGKYNNTSIFRHVSGVMFQLRWNISFLASVGVKTFSLSSRLKEVFNSGIIPVQENQIVKEDAVSINPLGVN